MSDALRQCRQRLKIGTARAGQSPATLAAPLDTLLPSTHADDPEAALWQSLGALDLYERSGFLPDAASAVPTAAPAPAAPERLRPCPARAEAMLARLLRGEHAINLQAEWLDLLARHGARLPARFLPTLLDAATRQALLRAPLLPVLGTRGHWLAGLQAQWDWTRAAIGGEHADDAAWDTGTPAQRIAALCAWRVRDAQAARAALVASWPSETPEQRASMLAVLAIGLGPDDEAFLDAALDDRRKEVRTVAQRLLAQLPDSQFTRRMLARLLPLLRVDKPLLGKARLELELPAECDAAMRRDGIGSAPHPGMGEKAGWMVDMLAAVDPGTWTARFERTPAACLALAEHGDFAGVLVRGWSLAVQRHARHDATPGLHAWLRALPLWWIGAAPGLRDAVPDTLFDLVAARFHRDADGASTALLDALPERWIQDPALVQLLHRLFEKSSATWPPALTRRMLQRLQAARPMRVEAGLSWLARQLLPALARVADPAGATAAEAPWRAATGPDDPWRSAIDSFFDLVRLRHEMILSFQEPA